MHTYYSFEKELWKKTKGASLTFCRFERFLDKPVLESGPAGSPDEYRTTLGPHLPQAQGEMDQLTHAFVEARYSQHAIEREDARRVRSSWQQVKTALRTLRRNTEKDS